MSVPLSVRLSGDVRLRSIRASRKRYRFFSAQLEVLRGLRQNAVNVAFSTFGTVFAGEPGEYQTTAIKAMLSVE